MFEHVEEKCWYKNKDQVNFLTSSSKEEENSDFNTPIIKILI